jgi:GNAT superfamily N-acetyltransferase
MEIVSRFNDKGGRVDIYNPWPTSKAYAKCHYGTWGWMGYWELFQFRVFDEHKGYGTAMLAAVYANAKKQGCKHMYACVYPDRESQYVYYKQFLERMGFKTVWWCRLFGSGRTMYAPIPNEAGEALLRSVQSQAKTQSQEQSVSQ